MALGLVLMRHAEAGWTAPGRDDAQRALTARGLSDARTAGRWLAGQELRPRLMAVSTAKRARDTGEAFRSTYLHSMARYEAGELYLAAPSDILECLSRLAAEPLLVIGHNPGLSELLDMLIVRGPQSGKPFCLPPAGAVVMECDVEAWDSLREGCARQVASFAP